MKNLIFILVVILSPITGFGQNAKSIYLDSKEALVLADYENAILLATKAKKLLGQTNPKIEALLVQAYFNSGDIVEAKVAYNKLLKLTPESIKSSKEFIPLLTLGEQIEKEVVKKEENFEKEINKNRLEQADKIIATYNSQNEKKLTLLEKNSKEDYFYNKALEEGSTEALVAFSKTFKNAATINKLKTEINTLKAKRGRVGAEGKLKNGKRHGIWKLYWTTGELQQVVNYNNGNVVGNYHLYIDKDDRKQATRDKRKAEYYRVVGSDENGNLIHTIREYYYPENKIKSEYTLKKEKENIEVFALKPFAIEKSVISGSLVNYYTNGNKKEELNFSQWGDLEGVCKYYYENGNVKIVIEYKDAKPYTVITKKWENGTNDEYTDLKNGSGSIVYVKYDLSKHKDDILGGGFSQLGKLMSSFSYYKDMKIDEVKDIYQAGVIKEKYIIHENKYYYFRYNIYGTFVEFMAETDKSFLQKKTMVLYNSGVNLTSQRLKYDVNQNLVSIESFAYGKVNSQFIVNNGKGFRFGGYASLQAQKISKKGLIEEVIAYPNLSKYERAVPVSGDSKYEAKMENFKKVYEHLIFDDNGIIETIYIRKKSNNKVVGTVALKHFTK